MMATHYSPPRAPGHRPTFRQWLGGLALALALAGAGLARAETILPPAEFAPQVRQVFEQARERFRQNTNDVATAWQFARAGFDWAEFATNNGQRATIANECIDVARNLVGREPASVAGQYYLAMNLGQLARTKLLGALSLVSEMERLFRRARELDAQFDNAGPDRCLGLLYLDAPGWPASVGSHSKARTHLERSVTLSGDFPENRLCLVEAYLRWGDHAEARKAAKHLEALLPKARARLQGEAWAWSWWDWDRRWRLAQERLAKIARR